MEDRDGKKPFIIPKTHTSTKDVLISEKTDSRNVTELFSDIKSCSLELHYDFRENQCKSCDLIRNQKLQKSYNQKKIQMKKDRDPTERFAFHLITSRDLALSIATDGLQCEQLTFPIEKYLGNPKDGIHLSRRPDVLLASSGAQGLYKFGLLVCKILLGKGYATIPSINNKQLPAQLHFDYHFCKIQAINKEQRHIDDLLGNSLIYCYEHEEFQTQSYPSQILPLAILWYDLTEKFPSELTSTSQESQQRKQKNSFKKKPVTKPITSANTAGTWDEPTQNVPKIPPVVQTTPPKYSSQFLIPFSSLYTSFCNSQLHSPLIEKVVTTTETVPLSPQNIISDLSPPLKRLMNEIKLPTKDIPMNSTTELLDPRLQGVKSTLRHIFYLESKAVKHALQQQKRLNKYYGSKSKTNYTLIPFEIRSMSAEEYERNHLVLKNASPFSISVIDCFHFGLKTPSNESYIDLEDNENQIAYEQIQMSDQLIEQEKQLNSKEIRLHLREKHQKKIQERFNEQRKMDFASTKIHVNQGRKLLKEYSEINSTNNQLPEGLLDFFSSEYRNEDRPHVKRILAELIGIFIEKYRLDCTTMIPKANEVLPMDNQTIQSAVDMEIASPCTEGLGDCDERFRIPTPPITDSIITSHDNIIEPIQIEAHLVEPAVPTNDDTTASPPLNNVSVEIGDHSNPSYDESVKLLTDEPLTTKSPSPTQIVNSSRQSHNGDDENKESNSDTKVSPPTRTVPLIFNNHQDNLVIQTTNTDQPETQEKEEEERTVKRIKVDLLAPPPLLPLLPPNDDYDYRQDLDERQRQEEILHSRSRSQSASSHNSSTKGSKPKSPSSASSNHSSSTNHQYGPQRRRYEQNRSYRYQQRNNPNPNPTPTRHQRFNYNHQSVSDHPRFAHTDIIPSPTKNNNYNSFSNTQNYSQNRNVNSSYSQSDYPYYQDNYNTNFPQLQPLMSAKPLMNYSNSYDKKPSDTIERLQSLLEITNPSYNGQQYQINSSENSNWSLSRYSSNQTIQNNQTFTGNDAEQLLTYVQRLRN